MTDQLIILLASTAGIVALGMLINFILEICVPDIQATGARDEIPFLKAASSMVNGIYSNDFRLNCSDDQRWDQDRPRIEFRAGMMDYFGQALASGDLDNNGADDLVVGVPGDDVMSAGAVNVLYAE